MLPIIFSPFILSFFVRSLAAFLFPGLILLFTSGCTEAHRSAPPIPPQDSSIFSPEPNSSFVDYIRAENSYTNAALFGEHQLENELTKEILEYQPAQGTSPPISLQPYLYFSVDEPALRHPLIYRQRHLHDRRELVFDPNIILQPYPQANFGVLRISPQHTAVAFSVDLQHSGKYSLFIWDISRRNIQEVSASDVQDLEWGKDDCLLFFTVRDRARPREFRVWNCQLPDSTKNIYSEKVSEFAVSLRRSKAGNELLLISESQVSTRVSSLDLHSEVLFLRPLLPFKARTKFAITAHPKAYFVRSTDGDLYSLARNNNAQRGRIPLSPFVRIEDFDVFENTVILFGRKETQPILQLYNLQTKTLLDVALPENVSALKRLATPDFHATHARVAVESLVLPSSVIEVDLKTAATRIATPPIYPAPFSTQDFTTKSVLVPTTDGVSIPITIAGLRKIMQGPEGSVLLLGYGAYGKVSAEEFSAARLSLMQRGFRIAVAHVRGDGILGQKWYDGGRRQTKKNSFEDFATCARYLIRNGYAKEDQLYAYGKSAGGLLVAVTAGMNPQLFRSIVLDRPFVDVIAGLGGEGTALNAREHEEWGDPKSPQERAYMESYSPVQQIGTYTFPPLLVISGLRDTIVPYWDVARWFALLRAKDRKITTQEITEKLLWIGKDATHDSEVDSYTEARLQSRINAFFLRTTEDMN